MKVLVTGGAGFIGSALVDRLLAEGHAVDVVDDLSRGTLHNLSEARADRRNRFSFHNLDVCDPALVGLLERRRPEIVFHLAAQVDVRVSVARPLDDARVNVLGTLNVAEACRAVGVRKIVFASSGGTIYGDVDPSDLPVKETHPQRPLSPYGVAKKAAGDYLAAYRALHGLEYTALALANVYGPRQDSEGEAGVVAIFAARILAGEPCTIFGDGSQTRDFVYVDDVVDAFVRAAGRGGGLLLNVGSGAETTINRLHQTMVSVAGADGAGVPLAPERAPARAGELPRNVLDPGRAATYLGWKAWTDLATGCREVLQWFAARPRG